MSPEFSLADPMFPRPSNRLARSQPEEPPATDEEGWIYKTHLDLKKETGLSRHEQNICLEELKKKNVLDHRLDYRINRDALDEIMEADLPSEIRKPDFAKSGKRIDFRELLIAIHHL